MNMSTTNKNADTKQDIISIVENHLKETITGTEYIQSKDIAKEVNLTPKQVGVVITDIDSQSNVIDIEKWAFTTSTVWKVTKTTQSQKASD